MPVPATLEQACPPLVPGSEAEANRHLRAIFADDAAREDALDPLSALLRGDIRETRELARIFTDSLARDRLASARQSLALLSSVDPCALDEPLNLSWHLFKRRKEQEVADLRPEMRLFEGTRPFNHFGGLHVELPALISPGGVFTYATEDDYRQTLRLYHAVPSIFDNAIGRFREGMAQGIVEPRITVEHMISQIDEVLGQGGDASPFLSPLGVLPGDLPQGAGLRIISAFQIANAQDILPAYQHLRSFLADEYLPRTRNSIGLAQLPGGDALYRALIHRETSLDLEPEAIHQLGLEEVDRIEAEMRSVAHQLGYDGPLPAFFRQIRKDPRFHPRSADELAQRFRKVAETIDARLPRYFAQLPATPLLVESYPRYRGRFEAGGSYSEAAGPKGSPATFFYNTYDLQSRFVSGVTTLYLHEGLPGHHLQISLARENAKLPAFQRYSDNDAFVEGWALYAETLGYDMGLYEDPLQHWGTLDDEMLRAMRLVVDTGIHMRRWSRETAIDYMLTHSGMGRSDAEAEVDRYIALPAQGLSYKIGALTIQSLRKEAEARLGPRFDIRAFHAKVIGAGSLPLDILEHRVDAWVNLQTGQAAVRRAR